jgi:hypothetical protein
MQRDKALAPIPASGLCMNQPNGGATVIYGIDDLSNKALFPIQQGGQVTGILLFLFDDAPRDVFETRPTIFNMSFEDVLGKSYNTQIPLGTMPAQAVQFHPGISMAVSKNACPSGAS